MTHTPREPDHTLPPELEIRLARRLATLPADWRVLAVQPQGRDWLVELADGSGELVCRLMLLGSRTAGPA